MRKNAIPQCLIRSNVDSHGNPTYFIIHIVCSFNFKVRWRQTMPTTLIAHTETFSCKRHSFLFILIQLQEICIICILHLPTTTHKFELCKEAKRIKSRNVLLFSVDSIYKKYAIIVALMYANCGFLKPRVVLIPSFAKWQYHLRVFNTPVNNRLFILLFSCFRLFSFCLFPFYSMLVTLHSYSRRVNAK